MPDYTVKADVDTMLRANDKAAIRSAIGVGQTDAPTFLAQTLTGQSLTGTQATNLLELEATWNTTGNPSLIYGRVTNGNSGTTAKLIDLGTFAGGSLFSVSKTGGAIVAGLSINQSTFNAVGISTNNWFSISANFGGNIINAQNNASGFAWDFRIASASILRLEDDRSIRIGGNSFLAAPAVNVLEQRNGTAAQAFRVYNTTDGTNKEYLNIGWSGNVLSIGASNEGTGVQRDLKLAANSVIVRPAGTDRWIFSNLGHLLAAADNSVDIGASGANRPRNIYAAGIIEGASIIRTTAGGFIAISSRLAITSPADGVMSLADNAGTSFGRIQLGGALDTHPAIARDGAGIKFTGAAAGSTSWIKVPAVAVASLPSAATAGVGARSFVNDALTPVFGSAVAGGGAVTVPVYSTGSAWNVG